MATTRSAPASTLDADEVRKKSNCGRNSGTIWMPGAPRQLYACGRGWGRYICGCLEHRVGLGVGHADVVTWTYIEYQRGSRTHNINHNQRDTISLYYQFPTVPPPHRDTRHTTTSTNMPALLTTHLPAPSPHSLRALSILSFPPAFVLLLTSGIISGHVNPSISLLPLFFSAAYAAILLANSRRCGCPASGLTGTPVHMMCDMLCAGPLLVCLILGWVSMGQRYRDAAGVILGSYGSVFVGFNL